MRHFLDDHRVPLYSEHLSYCSDDGQLYDLLPIPVHRRSRAPRRRAHPPGAGHPRPPHRGGERLLLRRTRVDRPATLREIEFINAVLAEADCDLLLDVNNVYVNSINHRYDAHDFLAALPGERIAYIHVAGHYDEAEDLKVDTHGAPVKNEVWALLARPTDASARARRCSSAISTFPPYAELVTELDSVRRILGESNDRSLTPCKRLKPLPACVRSSSR